MPRGFTNIKWRLARVLNWTGVTPLLMTTQRYRQRGHFVRATNAHATPAIYRATLERQLQYYQRRFCGVTIDDLTALVYEGRWEKPRPGLILTFDDGLRSNYRVAAPLLEKYGFTGWFFLPTEFLSTPPGEQARFAREHIIDVDWELLDPEAKQRLAMSWDEARDLARRHVVGSHTRSHCRMLPSLTAEQIADEIVGSRRILEEQLQMPIRTYCWVGGENDTYSAAAAQQIVDAGYEFAFVTTSAPIRANHDPFQIHRTNVDPHWHLDRVRFQLCGIMDFVYRRKRNRVRQLTRGDSATAGARPGNNASDNQPRRGAAGPLSVEMRSATARQVRERPPSAATG